MAWSSEPRPERRGTVRPSVIATLLAAAAATLVWYSFARPHHHPAARSWDPRVASVASFVQHEQRLPWKHPVSVQFLPSGQLAARFSTSLAAARTRPGPAGTDVARYVPAQDTLYIVGDALPLYTRFAVVGQLTRALHAEYPGAGSPAGIDSDAVEAQAAYLQRLTPDQARALRLQLQKAS